MTKPAFLWQQESRFCAEWREWGIYRSAGKAADPTGNDTAVHDDVRAGEITEPFVQQQGIQRGDLFWSAVPLEGGMGGKGLGFGAFQLAHGGIKVAGGHTEAAHPFGTKAGGIGFGKPDDDKITVGDVVVDMDSRTVRRGMEVQNLPPKEFELLYKLLAYPERTFTRMELLDEIWGIDSESDDKTVNVHINRLRNRFYDWPEFEIQTVRGLGYRAVKKV